MPRKKTSKKAIDMAAVAQVAADARLASIALSSISAKAQRDQDLGAVDLDLDFKNDATVRVLGSQLLVEAKCSLRGRDPSDETVLAVDVAYELVYETSRLHDLRTLEDFALLNGIYNAWPFFRETIYSITQKMGIAAVVLPLYVMGKDTD